MRTITICTTDGSYDLELLPVRKSKNGHQIFRGRGTKLLFCEQEGKIYAYPAESGNPLAPINHARGQY